jgi:hypothetical protein
MSSSLKSTVLGLALLAGTAAAAYAQSVSTLPPASSAPPAAPPAVTSSTQSMGPNPGLNGSWKDEHYQPSPGYADDKSQHPYSTSIGPNPGSHSSGGEANYKPTDADNDPARHPYTGNLGPKPN